jgi:peptidoglycan-associated lipoprotein
MLAACPSAPTQLINDAEKALREAAVVSECAPEEFKAAEERLAMAKRLVESGDYDEAEVQAKAALKLAQQAKKTGETKWDDCQDKKRRAAEEQAERDRAKNTPPDPKQLLTVYFDYNKATLGDKAQASIQANAEWLRRYPEFAVQIQGHCDERGTSEYNLALGERRAASVRDYLLQLGVDGSRMSILSYGEEKPASGGGSEDGHALNRRAEFAPK